MCIAMVIIQTKTLEKKVVDDVTSNELNLELQREPEAMMTQGPAFFSCGVMETGRWHGIGASCAIKQRPVGSSLENLWDGRPRVQQGQEGSSTGTITSLIQDLSLSEPGSATAPPSKRQCRSLSCSDELGGCRTAWRPHSSRVWTAVEKRRCHSGGSVQSGVRQAGHPAMQRSSSISLPAHCNGPALHAASPSFAGLAFSSSSEPRQPHYLSDEQICLLEPQGPSAPSSPDSTPELERRAGQGRLARSRSQPCVLNEKKIGMKRRRPEDTHKQRPSLDLAKMTQKLRNFHSLSCPGITGVSSCQSSHALPSSSSTYQYETNFTNQGAEALLNTKEGRGTREDSSIEELDRDSPFYLSFKPEKTNGKKADALWADLCGITKDACQLGGELDIDQIERN